MIDKKAISPVVATALLIVVAVVAVVGFQTWFNTYSSNLFISTEQQSETDAGIELDSLIGNKLYIQSSKNMSLNKISISGTSCNLNVSLEDGMNTIDVSSCLENVTGTQLEVFIQGNDSGISSKYFFRDNSRASNLGNESSEGVGNGVINLNYNCIWSDRKEDCYDNLSKVYQIDGCGDETVLDKSTGICWDRNFSRTGGFNYTNAIDHCDSFSAHPSGNTEWELPTRQEFRTIFDTSLTSAPQIVGNGSYFKGVQSIYWTHTDSDVASLFAFDGPVIYSSFSGSEREVVCVSRDGSVDSSNTRVNEWLSQQYNTLGDGLGLGQIRNTTDFNNETGCGPGTIVDETTQLCWDSNLDRGGTELAWANDDSYSQPIWNGEEYEYPIGRSQSDYPAFEYCDTQNHAGHSDWRLPTMSEFNTLRIDPSSGNNCQLLQDLGFENCRGGGYNTESEVSSSGSRPFYFDLDGDAGEGSGSKTTTRSVTCVRRD